MVRINAIAVKKAVRDALTLLFNVFVAIIKIIWLCVHVPEITVKQLEIRYLFEGWRHEGSVGVQSKRRGGKDYDHD